MIYIYINYDYINIFNKYLKKVKIGNISFLKLFKILIIVNYGFILFIFTLCLNKLIKCFFILDYRFNRFKKSSIFLPNIF